MGSCLTATYLRDMSIRKRGDLSGIGEQKQQVVAPVSRLRIQWRLWFFLQIWCFYGDLMVINPLVMEYEWLVGGLEHFSIYWEFDHPQLTNSYFHIFQRGRLEPPNR